MTKPGIAAAKISPRSTSPRSRATWTKQFSVIKQHSCSCILQPINQDAISHIHRGEGVSTTGLKTDQCYNLTSLSRSRSLTLCLECSIDVESLLVYFLEHTKHPVSSTHMHTRHMSSTNPTKLHEFVCGLECSIQTKITARSSCWICRKGKLHGSQFLKGYCHISCSICCTALTYRPHQYHHWHPVIS